MDFAVVPPAGPHRAAALLLGGVARHDVVAEVGVVQVVVALFSLLAPGGGMREQSAGRRAHVSCGRSEVRGHVLLRRRSGGAVPSPGHQVGLLACPQAGAQAFHP